ncbi:putative baseplate assembly protein [Roseivivax lentus]|uniref:Putative baseplate assembly protein n=1 Tax=Roseivivax lentus TaxID=633194 RepID=A0A1N7NUC9_9RHOB|nr:baseplate J/gp47 family protein [Roseivivax lentus]SIT01829.1 putative baseplate assembly protein [Roseivivax lentus]
MARVESFLDQRRERLAASAADINGIAGIEVDLADPTILRVTMVHPLPGEAGGRPSGGAALGPGDLTIRGGDRFPAVRPLGTASNGRVLTVTVNRVGDFSTYVLSIDEAVAGIDPLLRSVEFRFRVHCDTDLDCEDPPLPPEPPVTEPRLDHLARDYESYRRMMLDRMAVTVPDWTERNPASLGVTLVEWLASVGDELSYKLDHVGTEYSLGSARLRSSAMRHARLTGYRAHNGVSARTFVQVRLRPGVPPFALPETGVAFLTRSRTTREPVIALSEVERELRHGAVAFEPVTPRVRDAVTGNLVPDPVTLHDTNHDIELHHWGDPNAVLAKGATEAWLRNPQSDVQLQAGDILILSQLRDPGTRRAADADPACRQAVRLTEAPVVLTDPLEQVDIGAGPIDLPLLRIRWAAEDALGFDLHVGLAPGETEPMAIALGNIVLADHGFTLPEPEPLGAARGLFDPEDLPVGTPLSALDRPRSFRPHLSRRDLTHAVRPFVPADTLAAAAYLTVPPEDAVAAITLSCDAEADPWTPRADFIGTAADALAFVPEVEADGTTRLRFWAAPGGTEGLHGKTPEPGETFEARYRVGTGTAGNVGAEAIAHIAASGIVAPNVASVTNPLAATGGRNRETIAEIRQRAPLAFTRQYRAVTLADYEALLTDRDDVQRAQARKRDLGGWTAIFLTVDRVGGLEIDTDFRRALLAYLEPFRMMGHDLAIDAPVYVPLAIELKACAEPDAFADRIAEALEDRFSTGLMRDGRRGYFHPDNITFSSDIYLSRLYEAALEVDGVSDVRITRFSRAGRMTDEGLDAGVLSFGPREIPILSNDPNRPSEGSLTIVAEGGR